MTWYKPKNPRPRHTPQELYDMKHGITDENRPRCTVCGKPCHVTNSSGYSKTCSPECTAKQIQISKRQNHFNGLGPRERYDLEHGITDENRPKCPWCGGPAKWTGPKHGYRPCSRSCATHLQMKEGRKRKPKKVYLNQQQYDLEHDITDANRPKCPVCGKFAHYSEVFQQYKKCCSQSCTTKLSMMQKSPNGLVGQARYDFEHGITVDTRPKCIICSSERKFIGHQRGYHEAFCYEHAKYENIAESYRQCDIIREQRNLGFNRGHLYDLKHCTKPIALHRSALEKIVFTYLEIIDCTYEVEPISIQWCDSNGKLHKYRPDLIVHYKNKHLLIEIKPKCLLTDDVNQRKFAAATQFVQTTDWLDTFAVLTDDRCHTPEQIEQFLNELVCQK